MKKLALLFSSLFGSTATFFTQDILPFVEVPADHPFSDLDQDKVAIGDINGNGFDDIIFFENNATSFKHFVNLGSGSIEELNPFDSPLEPVFSAVENIYSNWYLNLSDIQFADVDNDGDQDLVFELNYSDGWLGCDKYNFYHDILIFENAGDGSFNTNSSEEILLDSDCASRLQVSYIDIDTDGDFDVLKYKSIEDYGYPYGMVNFSFIDLSIFNNNTQEFENATEVDGEQYFGEVYDINSDGLDDVVTRNEIRLNTGMDLNFDNLIDLNLGDNIFPFDLNHQEIGASFGLGDFDNSGFVDLLAWSPNQDSWRYFTQNCSQVEGLPCDDQDTCTENDVYDDNCNCIGVEAPDSDGDGICDLQDQCPGQNDTIDGNLNNIPDCLETQNDADLELEGEEIVNSTYDVSNERNLLIFPNPSSGIFTFQSNIKIKSLRLFNAVGEEMPIFLSGQNQIDLSTFSKGIYFVELKMEESLFRKKLIKE